MDENGFYSGFDIEYLLGKGFFNTMIECLKDSGDIPQIISWRSDDASYWELGNLKVVDLYQDALGEIMLKVDFPLKDNSTTSFTVHGEAEIEMAFKLIFKAKEKKKKKVRIRRKNRF